ncbi:MAG: T9SS type A sorting domain-containing protein [Bacteroidetes bacterium]|nr:T9SS type A sorting domain-containing protein [Bacteroidota bacterium]MBT5529229.1 T9SS type A sorting domain-containing protein [Cytophagia bacterium]MBT3424378.1 T9SS type A sorting domain-containing protein [Bacteroidota bacterium]MBT3799947.1 T9SS type A sorting domain-containing protein [Bacteroidota bacterium]MBT3932801.1 T9SS type A sorting domain-containing protein [Bacteroidota bacterium]
METIDKTKSYSYYENSNTSKIKVTELVKQTNISDGEQWMTSVSTLPYKIEHEVPNPELLKEIKKQQNQYKIDHINSSRENFSDTYRAAKPSIFRNFESNLPLQGTPPDNSMAISNNGIIVSAINSNIVYFDTDGKRLFSKTFYDFYNDADLNGKLYDPKIIYDSGADRFIFVALHGNHTSNNKILVSFSITNNPLDGWNIYYLPILEISSIYTSKWLDYPNVGVSNTEVFITGNVFLNNEGGFSESIIIQMDKQAGYAGNSLTWKTWKDIKDGNGNKPFTLCPISWGHQGNYGPGLYFVSNSSHGQSADIFLYSLTNNMNSNPSLLSYTIKSSLYKLAGDAVQKNEIPTISPGLMDIGDCRIQGGFYQISRGVGIVHFVFHSEYNLAYNGINYNRLDLSKMQNTSKLYGGSNMDFAYPSVASSSPNASHDRDVMIGFLASSDDYYPEIRAVYCDDEMEFSSPITIKKGATFVNILEGTERWGDYSGISRKHNTSAPRIWLSGCFGSNIRDMGTFPPIIENNVYRTWIAEVADNALTDMEESEELEVNVSVFPNPVHEMMTLEFSLQERAFISIKIIDMQGKVVRELYNDLTKKGKTILRFNKLALQSGNYLIQIIDGEKILKTEKIIVN